METLSHQGRGMRVDVPRKEKGYPFWCENHLAAREDSLASKCATYDNLTSISSHILNDQTFLCDSCLTFLPSQQTVHTNNRRPYMTTIANRLCIWWLNFLKAVHSGSCHCFLLEPFTYPLHTMLAIQTRNERRTLPPCANFWLPVGLVF